MKKKNEQKGTADDKGLACVSKDSPTAYKISPTHCYTLTAWPILIN